MFEQIVFESLGPIGPRASGERACCVSKNLAIKKENMYFFSCDLFIKPIDTCGCQCGRRGRRTGTTVASYSPD
jgi:hypothetical protein